MNDTVRYLIVNADDFGQSPGVNRGIITAHEQGIVTSASMMVRWPAALHAASYAREHRGLSVGLHIDLGEWIYHDANWACLYEVAPLDDAVALREAVQAQMRMFIDLLGRDPTHLDSHQHVHRDEPLRSIVVDIAQQIGVPIRHFHDRIRYCGVFYGQTGKGEPYPIGISMDHLLATLNSLEPGITELGCHPGVGGDVESMYCHERAEEVNTLCNPQVRQALEEMQIELCGFQSLPK